MVTRDPRRAKDSDSEIQPLREPKPRKIIDDLPQSLNGLREDLNGLLFVAQGDRIARWFVGLIFAFAHLMFSIPEQYFYSCVIPCPAHLASWSVRAFVIPAISILHMRRVPEIGPWSDSPTDPATVTVRARIG